MPTMLQLIATILLILATGVTTTLALWPTAGSRQTRYLALTALLLCLAAIIVPQPVGSFYKAAIVLGLLLYLVNRGLQMLPGVPAVVDYALTLIGTLLYMAAFAATHAGKWPTPWVLLPVIGSALLYWRLRPRLAELHGSIVIYMIAFFLMLWQAVEMSVVNPAPWAISGLLGALGLTAAQTVLGIHHFIHPVPYRQRWSSGATVLGYGLIGLSIWGPALSQFVLWR